MKKREQEELLLFYGGDSIYDFVIEMMNFFSLLLHNRSVSLGSIWDTCSEQHLLGVHSITVFLTLCALRSNPIALQSLLDIYPACLFSVLITSQSILYLLFLYYYLLSQYSLLRPYHLEPWPSCALPCVLSVPLSLFNFLSQWLNTIFIPTAFNLTWSRFHSKNR